MILMNVDSASPVPIYRQLVDQISFALTSGRLGEEDRLPSAREVAAELSINLHTVAKAYQQLVQEGLLEFRRGKGTFVARRTPQTRPRSLRRSFDAPLSELCRDALSAGVTWDEFVELVEERWKREERSRTEREKRKAREKS